MCRKQDAGCPCGRRASAGAAARAGEEGAGPWRRGERCRAGAGSPEHRLRHSSGAGAALPAHPAESQFLHQRGEAKESFPCRLLRAASGACLGPPRAPAAPPAFRAGSLLAPSPSLGRPKIHRPASGPPALATAWLLDPSAGRGPAAGSPVRVSPSSSSGAG